MSSKYIWLKKKDYIKRSGSIAKFLYYTGIIKQKRWNEPAKNYYAADKEGDERPYQIHSGGFYRARFGFRWWNPLTYVFIIIAGIIGWLRFVCEATKEFIKQLKEEISYMEFSDPMGLMKKGVDEERYKKRYG
jgi:hypothetical protein